MSDEEFVVEEGTEDPEEVNVSSKDLDSARSAIRESQVGADRLMKASRELEHLVFGVTTGDSSMSTTEYDIQDARRHLEQHNLFRARSSVRKAEKTLKTLELDVVELRRNIAMLNRLLKEKTIAEAEVEVVLRRLRNATSAAEIGDVGFAAVEVEQLIGDLVVDSATALNPFLFRTFWLGVDTRWPAGGEKGVLLIRVVNDGDRPLPEMRLEPPVPKGWVCEPKTMDIPSIRPGGFLPVKFELNPGAKFSPEQMPLSRKLTIQTGYEIRSGQVNVIVRAQNRSMETLRDIILKPWMPPGYTSEVIPLIEKLTPDEVGIIRMPLIIDMGEGGVSSA
jgi:hypothetical protein